MFGGKKLIKKTKAKPKPAKKVKDYLTSIGAKAKYNEKNANTGLPIKIGIDVDVHDYSFCIEAGKLTLLVIIGYRLLYFSGATVTVMDHDFEPVNIQKKLAITKKEVEDFVKVTDDKELKKKLKKALKAKK